MWAACVLKIYESCPNSENIFSILEAFDTNYQTVSKKTHINWHNLLNQFSHFVETANITEIETLIYGIGKQENLKQNLQSKGEISDKASFNNSSRGHLSVSAQQILPLDLP